MTSYQKLKQENAKLKSDIAKIVMGDVEVTMQYKMKIQLEKAVWIGSTDTVVAVKRNQ